MKKEIEKKESKERYVIIPFDKKIESGDSISKITLNTSVNIPTIYQVIRVLLTERTSGLYSWEERVIFEDKILKIREEALYLTKEEAQKEINLLNEKNIYLLINEISKLRKDVDSIISFFRNNFR